MAGQFPQSPDIKSFWKNICNGNELIKFYNKDELLTHGLTENQINAANFVPAAATFDGIDEFDAAFFGIPPAEANLMDPQHRLLLQCAWSTLEDAGLVPGELEQPVGLFAGISANSYLLHDIIQNPDIKLDDLTVLLCNEKDFAISRIAYKLGLRGPVMAVQTACSTSLVSVHLACQSLLNGECDVALAGAASVQVNNRFGYKCSDDSIFTPDGHCRSFDEKGEGTLFGSGLGLVALKRLEDALEDNDQIYAIIKGTAINNDGANKVSYTSPSSTGQSEVIQEALDVSGVTADQIGYVEAHGTATPIGDPIEFHALQKVFGKQTSKKHFCYLGAVKSNIGHLDTAAGIAGLIKTALVLQTGKIPPTLHYTTPNPKLNIQDSAFKINTELETWNASGEKYAGVSSFGIGGTNAHAILQSPPTSEKQNVLYSSSLQIFPLSASTETALTRMKANLWAHITQNSDIQDKDVAYTLQNARKNLAVREAIVAENRGELLEALARSMESLTKQQKIGFCFPEELQFSADALTEMREAFSEFNEEYENCISLLQETDVASLPNDSHLRSFVIYMSLANSLIRLGVNPSAFYGRGAGLLVCGCLAGVFSISDGVLLARQRDLPSTEKHTIDIKLQTTTKPCFSAGSIQALSTPQLTSLAFWEAIEPVADADTGLFEQLRNQHEYRFIELVLGRKEWCRTLCQCWESGHDVIWPQNIVPKSAKSTSLPTYPFDKNRFWVAKKDMSSLHSDSSSRTKATKRGIEKWCSVASWEPAESTTISLQADKHRVTTVLVFNDELGVGQKLSEQIKQEVDKVLFVSAGNTFQELSDHHFIINPSQPAHYKKLFEVLKHRNSMPSNILHLWGLSKSVNAFSLDSADMYLGFYSQLFLCQTLSQLGSQSSFTIKVCGNNTVDATPQDRLHPEKAVFQAPTRSVNYEQPNLYLQFIDIDIDEVIAAEQNTQFVRTLLLPDTQERMVAFRRDLPWKQKFSTVSVPQVRDYPLTVKSNGVYLITGGLGQLGLNIAKSLSRKAPKILLIGRSKFIHRDEWDSWLRNNPADNSVSQKIQAIKKMESNGAVVDVVSVDITNLEQLQKFADSTVSTLGPINGIIHAAGIISEKQVDQLDEVELQTVTAPKIIGTRNLYHVFDNTALEFFVSFSSLSAVTGGTGQLAYSVGNSFQDAFARKYARESDSTHLSINWPTWKTDEHAALSEHLPQHLKEAYTAFLNNMITMDEGLDIFQRLLNYSLAPQILVSPIEITEYMEVMRDVTAGKSGKSVVSSVSHNASDSKSQVISSIEEMKVHIIQTWKAILGLDDLESDTNFFELGGDSLLAISIINKLNEVLPFKLPVNKFLEYPTVAELTDYIENNLWPLDSDKFPSGSEKTTSEDEIKHLVL
uniref:Malonyl CoA-acyl carrier protein transacylase n=1 Tax=Rheinheimera sp. BAL341 TaxID=1708203 RepID=A0A486XPY1_9GAMM